MSILFSKSGSTMVMTKRNQSWLSNIQNLALQVRHSVASLWQTTSEKSEKKGQRALNRSKMEYMINQSRWSPAQNEFSIYSNRIIK